MTSPALKVLYGLRWSEFDADDRLVTKEAFFTTELKRQAFIAKLERKPNFNSIESFTSDASATR